MPHDWRGAARHNSGRTRLFVTYTAPGTAAGDSNFGVIL